MYVFTSIFSKGMMLIVHVQAQDWTRLKQDQLYYLRFSFNLEFDFSLAGSALNLLIWGMGMVLGLRLSFGLLG